MTIKAHDYLDKIVNYIPGKSQISGRKTIKLSSNENALGSSTKSILAYKNHSDEIFRYASGSCEALREKIAQKNNINADNIVCGAGSDEVISLLTYAFCGPGDEVIYSQHGFLMYPISAKKAGATPVKVKEKNLRTDIDAIIAAISDKTKIIFIANPNNPTGSYVTDVEIDKLIAKTPKNIVIVLDNAYAEFVEKDDYPNSAKLVQENENVVMTRTFSKIYGLASLRIGWGYSSKYVADILNKVRGPFNVGGPAQEAAIAALDDEEFLQKSKNHNDKWLETFFSRLENVSRITAHPSIANFILLDFGSEDSCQKADDFLQENGFILRQMSSYGLPNCLRATIGTEEENLALLNLLDEFSK